MLSSETKQILRKNLTRQVVLVGAAVLLFRQFAVLPARTPRPSLPVPRSVGPRGNPAADALLLEIVSTRLHYEDIPVSAKQVRAIVQRAEQALKQGADPDARGKDGEPALRSAFDNGNSEMAAVLIAHGADVNRPYPGTAGRTPLMEEAGWGLEEDVEMLLRGGAHTEARDDRGETALLYALGNCRPENVRALVNDHADVNVRDAAGRTALSLAKEGSARRLTTSFNHGTDEDRKESWGEIVHLLEKAGAKQ